MSDIKFKLGFTINAETLFTLMSKLLPIEDVTVEEIVPRTAPEQPLLAKDTFTSKLTGKTYYKNKKPKQYKRRPTKPVDLHAGINRIVVEALSHGMGRPATDLIPLVKKGGYSSNSVGSRLQNLREHGVVEQLGGGLWRLTEKYMVEAQPLPKVATTEAGPASR